jgi:hypothetical protein
MKCPLGLVYRPEYIRTLKFIWNKQSTKDYIIDSCKRASGNIKPIIVIDENNLNFEAKCYLINRALDGFEEHHDHLLCRKVEAISEYMKNKYNIQKSKKLSKEDKEKSVKLNEDKNLWHKELSSKEDKELEKVLKSL